MNLTSTEPNHIPRNDWLCYVHFAQFHIIDTYIAEAAGSHAAASLNGVRPSHEWITARLKHEVVSNLRFNRVLCWVRDRVDSYAPMVANVAGSMPIMGFERKVARRVVEVMGVSVCCALPPDRWKQLCDDYVQYMRVSPNALLRTAALRVVWPI